MKDLHSHIYYGIDDGPKTIEESIELLKLASNSGITDIFMTPHYIKNSDYVANNKKKNVILNKLKKAIVDNGIDINIYCGNEIYLTDGIVDLIKNGEIDTLNNTKYILIEFSLFNEDKNAIYLIDELIKSGYIPILAHPERYTYLDRGFTLLKELKDLGCLFQGNYQSLFGKYGKDAKKRLKKLLKMDYISFLGSDIHHAEEMNMDKLYKKLKRIVKTDEKVDALLKNNVDNIIKSE